MQLLGWSFESIEKVAARKGYNAGGPLLDERTALRLRFLSVTLPR